MSSVLRTLADDTGLTPFDVRRIAASAPDRYKTFSISKRSGGQRIISQPARELKVLQRALVRRFLTDLPVHDCATAYRTNTSILANASAHSGSGRPILKLDFSDFFTSIRDSDWISYCIRNSIPFSQEDLELTSRILFKRVPGARGLRLAIGAPSSPMLSNILMFDFDQQIHNFVMTERVIYTRYADDLTFSAQRTGFLNKVVKMVRHVIRETRHPRLTLNEFKTVYATAKYTRVVTGLVLSNDGRVTIGREKKRLISSAVYRAAQSLLSPLQMQALAGTLAYVNAVEPTFLSKLQLRYGVNVLREIQTTERLPRGERSKSPATLLSKP